MTLEEPTPLGQLYARNPFTLTRDGPEIAQMVEALRAQRSQFAATPPGERPKRAAKPKPTPVSLDELDLGL